MTTQLDKPTLVIISGNYGRSEHWYRFGNEPLLPSVTSILDVLKNWQIVNAAAKEVAWAAVRQRHKLFAIAETDEAAAVEVFKGAHWQAWGQKRDRGIDVHAMIATGAPPGPDQVAYVDQYHRWLEESGATMIGHEIEVVSLTGRYGGKLDLFAEVTRRNLVIDVKVRDDLRVFPERLMQVAAYAKAEHGLPLPADGAAVLTLGAGGYSFVEVEDLEAALRGFLGLRAYAEFLGRTERSEG